VIDQRAIKQPETLDSWIRLDDLLVNIVTKKVSFLMFPDGLERLGQLTQDRP
jgi:hypothetical protein